jgi:hypothetical protein
MGWDGRGGSGREGRWRARGGIVWLPEDGGRARFCSAFGPLSIAGCLFWAESGLLQQT